ncbi:hypothetical protein K488DRAFT_90617 [Vararia minispora EC-137]|uniref:Uncharacterized protein n=1 Tax=Vararia minispora EC-137 TaxID=1314806 RepID=A0ACB8Q761_9AGAM|nr:hypothetical protein K488DRAFT_90617 [Vararia minispora EC-137]
MAESHQRTQALTQQTQEAIANRLRKEEDRKRQQEEQERKEREVEAQIRHRHFEELQREKERQERKKKEQGAREREEEQREQEREENLLGRSKGSQRPTSVVNGRRGSRQGRLDSEVTDDGMSAGAMALTREEKRERRLANEFRLPGTSKRTSANTGFGGAKGARRLPGGAMDVVGSLRSSESSLPSGSHASSSREIRARIAASPNALIQVNTVKRDRRTIDEHMRDKARFGGEAKVLNGDDARSFGKWFSSRSKPSTPRDSPLSKSRASSHDPATPPPLIVRTTTSSTSASVGPRIPKKLPLSQSLPTSNASSAPTSDSLTRLVSPVPRLSDRTTRMTQTKKRARSSSFDSYDSDIGSPPPRRKPKPSDLQAEIWSIFGKKRDTYVSRDVYSDDEDMEANALDVEKEEKRSARLGRMEDLEAEKEEKRREEGKRRRRQAKI